MNRSFATLFSIAFVLSFVSLSLLAKPPKTQIERVLESLSKKKPILLAIPSSRPQDTWSLEIIDQEDGFLLSLSRSYSLNFKEKLNVLQAFVRNEDKRNTVSGKNPNWIKLYAKSSEGQFLLKGWIVLSVLVDQNGNLVRFKIDEISKKTKAKDRYNYLGVQMVPLSKIKEEEAKLQKERFSCAGNLQSRSVRRVRPKDRF